jgi:hypothetical protein
MKGYRKLRISCALAARQGLNYLWIDTCCIDKTSSADLSEAINSMFRYYREAQLCYAYLSDVASVKIPNQLKDEDSNFYQSVWFTRGWTLQELIAPKNQLFYNKDWDYLGTKAELKDAICHITNIPKKILLGGDLSDEPVSIKMSWASSRETTVPEDISYCLLGMFDVNIPLLYGEGEEKAFLRLQEAILKSTDDESIFLWCSTEAETIKEPFWGLLAKSPTYFSRSPDIGTPCTTTLATNTPATLTGRGLNVEFLLAPVPNDVSESIYSTLIFVDGGKRAYGLLLQKLSYLGGQFARVGADILLEIDSNMKLNYSKLPHRISTRWGPGFDRQLKEPQAMRFYVQQNPKISSAMSNEAVGFYFDPVKSLPPQMEVDDWSSRWSRWEGGLFTNSGTLYLLEYESDQHLKSPIFLRTNKLAWKTELFGILLLSEQFADPPEQLALCAGLEQTSVNFLNMPLSCHRPWCIIYPTEDSTQNSDEILKDFYSPRSQLLLELDNRDKPNIGSSNYAASFELQIRNGQVHYLIIVTRLLERDSRHEKDLGDLTPEVGALQH